MALSVLKKMPVSFVWPTVAAAGAFAGLLVGTSQDNSLLGAIIGAIVLALICVIVLKSNLAERTARWGIAIAMIVAGFFIASTPGVVVGAIFGFLFGWLIYWLSEGRYLPTSSFMQHRGKFFGITASTSSAV